MAQEVTTDMAESAASQTEFYTVTVNQDEESPHEVLNTSETKDSYSSDDREHSPVRVCQILKLFLSYSKIFLFSGDYIQVRWRNREMR